MHLEARVGYSQEESYFNRVNREIIEKMKSDAAQADQKVKDAKLPPSESSLDPKINRFTKKNVKR